MASVSVEAAPVEAWRLRPCDYIHVMSEAARLEIINEYFTECARTGRRPLLTGLALAAGYSGVTEMRRAAMRSPDLRYAMSRAFTVVAACYEEMIGSVGGNGPLFMLKNMPDYDSMAPEGAPATQPFQERFVVEEHVSGVKTIESEGLELSPRAAYLKLIKNTTNYDDLEVTTVEPVATNKLHNVVLTLTKEDCE